MSAKSGRVVVVTGASRGIGAVTAAAFARCGDTVFANYPDQDGDSHQKAVETWRDRDGIEEQRVIPIAADVSQVERVSSMFDTVKERLGRLDVLVNNAGINRDHTVVKMTDQEWHGVLRVNLDGVFYCSRAAIPLLRDGGKIVNISSMVALTGIFGTANYAASKAGVLGLTKTLALELAARDITVNAICPGFIDTEMARTIPQEFREKYLRQIPLKRVGTPQDIAACVLFLASREADYITGQSVSVNGGVYMGG